MKDVVIVATGRTPIGRANKGSLADVRADDMLAFVIKGTVAKSGINSQDIEDVIVGNTMPGGSASAINIARGASFLAGFPETVGGVTVNRMCSSSLEAIRMAYHAVACDEGDAFVCAGVESVSCAGGAIGDVYGLAHPRVLAGAVPNIYLSMGMTAENVAEQFDISREDMDKFGQQSQERALAAQMSGFFDREILPYPKADGTTVTADDGPRPSSTLEGLAQLPPLFKEGGRITAGNSCPLNDGAAAVVVMSAEKAKAEGIKPLARVVASAVSGVAPEIMGVGPIGACRKVLANTGMTINEIDVMELNEAFAAQVLAVVRELGLDEWSDRLNPHGGAIALGHPFGMTGCRIVTTLINDLQTLDRTLGLATMCVGGGQGLAMIIERCA